MHVLKRSQFFCQWNPSKTSHQTEKVQDPARWDCRYLSSQLGITRSRANDIRQLAKCTKHFVTDNMQDAPIEMTCLADKKVNQTINLMIKQDQKDKLEKEIPLVSFF